jgi:hypothetical protein
MTKTRTGVRNPECYAEALTDCSDKLSREHCLTESVLKAIALDDEIEVEGLAWQVAGTSKDVGTKGLASWILCDRHNSALSGADATALRLFKTIEGILLNFGEERNEQHHINGDEFERWMLRTLCGFAVAKLLVDPQGEKIVGWKAPLEWLEIIFEGRRFPPSCGMYLLNTDQGKPVHQSPKLLRLASLTGPDKNIWGLRMWLFQLEILLIMDTSPCQGFHNVGIYQPKAISYFDDLKTKAVVFDWQHGAGGEDFPIRIVKLPDETGS